VAFQYKLLPVWAGRHVSRVYFWPTLPITLLRSWMAGKGLWCAVDDTLVLGVAPLALLGHPGSLYRLGVRGVVNMTYEFSGPEFEYERRQMKQLRLPTVDHEEPRLEDLKEAVQFIEGFRKRGERVYVHCKAGHGRAGAVALAWLAFARSQGSEEQLRELNAELLARRRVRKGLHQQPNVRAFGRWVRDSGRRGPVAAPGGEGRGGEVEMAVRQRFGEPRPI